MVTTHPKLDELFPDASRKKNAACGVVASRLKQKISTCNKVGARHKSIVNQEDILGAVGPKRTAGQGAFIRPTRAMLTVMVPRSSYALQTRR